jgi:hypothetical protein
VTQIDYFHKADKFHELLQKIRLVGGQSFHFYSAKIVSYPLKLCNHFSGENNKQFFTLFSVQKVLVFSIKISNKSFKLIY